VNLGRLRAVAPARDGDILPGMESRAFHDAFLVFAR
jgi:hypothetical protein